MLFRLLRYVFYTFIYTPESYMTCENGYHKFGDWNPKFYNSLFQRRRCNNCGFTEETLIKTEIELSLDRYIVSRQQYLKDKHSLEDTIKHYFQINDPVKIKNTELAGRVYSYTSFVEKIDVLLNNGNLIMVDVDKLEPLILEDDNGK